MTTPRPPIEEHPDLAAMRAKYERFAATRTAQALDGLTFLAGLYCAISPWVLGFGGTTLAVNDLVIGLALAVLAVGFAAAYGHTHGLAFVAPLLGVWMILAPWLAAGAVATTSNVISNVIVGGAAVVFGLGQAAMGAGAIRRHQ